MKNEEQALIAAGAAMRDMVLVQAKALTMILELNQDQDGTIHKATANLAIIALRATRDVAIQQVDILKKL